MTVDQYGSKCEREEIYTLSIQVDGLDTGSSKEKQAGDNADCCPELETWRLKPGSRGGSTSVIRVPNGSDQVSPEYHLIISNIASRSEGPTSSAWAIWRAQKVTVARYAETL